MAVHTRPAPAEPEASSSASANKVLVPWHLDRLDQHSLPLDNKFKASADGTGVNVYLLSSVSLGRLLRLLLPPLDCRRCRLFAYSTNVTCLMNAPGMVPN